MAGGCIRSGTQTKHRMPARGSVGVGGGVGRRRPGAQLGLRSLDTWFALSCISSLASHSVCQVEASLESDSDPSYPRE